MRCSKKCRAGTAKLAVITASVLIAGCGSDAPPPPKTYVTSCMTCHGEGLGGAPVTGDKDEWARRIAKGVAKVRRNAIEGFEGGTGIMPARGGNEKLSDAEVTALVDYMIEASQ